MIDLIPQAIAQASQAAPQPSTLETLFPIFAMLGIFYFLLIRPQAKKAKQHEKLLSDLKSGEEVVTSGGIIGRVRSVSQEFVSVEVSNNSIIKVLKSNIVGLTKKNQEVVKTSKNPKKAKFPT